MRTLLVVGVIACSKSSSDDSRSKAVRVTVKDDVVEVTGGTFFAPRLACPDHTTTPRTMEELHSVLRRIVAEQSEASFRIHRQPVQCDDYRECVAVGRCERAMLGSFVDGCQRGYAIVTQEQASRYCAWRGGRLPTFAQWHMAMVGARTPKDAEAAISESIPWCKAETPKDGRFEPAPEDWPRCERVGPYGARYALRNPNIGEWTSDTECMQEAPAPPEPVLILLSRPRLEGIASVTTEGGEFRCVW